MMAPSERFALWFASACVALTRIPALSRSLWDWDEALFCFAMQDYNVPAYRPHPPGFPLFLAAWLRWVDRPGWRWLGAAWLCYLMFEWADQRAKCEAIGRCSACGYDLRATPERCPECGARVDTKSKTDPS